MVTVHVKSGVQGLSLQWAVEGKRVNVKYLEENLRGKT